MCCHWGQGKVTAGKLFGALQEKQHNAVDLFAQGLKDVLFEPESLGKMVRTLGNRVIGVGQSDRDFEEWPAERFRRGADETG